MTKLILCFVAGCFYAAAGSIESIEASSDGIDIRFPGPTADVARLRLGSVGLRLQSWLTQNQAIQRGCFCACFSRSHGNCLCGIWRLPTHHHWSGIQWPASGRNNPHLS